MPGKAQDDDLVMNLVDLALAKPPEADEILAVTASGLWRLHRPANLKPQLVLCERHDLIDRPLARFLAPYDPPRAIGPAEE